jgi:hypothetical protein
LLRKLKRFAITQQIYDKSSTLFNEENLSIKKVGSYERIVGTIKNMLSFNFKNFGHYDTPNSAIIMNVLEHIFYGTSRWPLISAYTRSFYEEPLFRLWYIYLNHLSWQELTERLIEKLAISDIIHKPYDTKSEHGDIFYYANAMFGYSLEIITKVEMLGVAPVDLMLLSLSPWIYPDLANNLPGLFWGSLAYKQDDKRMEYLLKDSSALISLTYALSAKGADTASLQQNVAAMEKLQDIGIGSYPAIEYSANNMLVGVNELGPIYNLYFEAEFPIDNLYIHLNHNQMLLPKSKNKIYISNLEVVPIKKKKIVGLDPIIKIDDIRSLQLNIEDNLVVTDEIQLCANFIDAIHATEEPLSKDSGFDFQLNPTKGIKGIINLNPLENGGFNHLEDYKPIYGNSIGLERKELMKKAIYNYQEKRHDIKEQHAAYQQIPSDSTGKKFMRFNNKENIPPFVGILAHKKNIIAKTNNNKLTSVNKKHQAAIANPSMGSKNDNIKTNRACNENSNVIGDSNKNFLNNNEVVNIDQSYVATNNEQEYTFKKYLKEKIDELEDKIYLQQEDVNILVSLSNAYHGLFSVDRSFDTKYLGEKIDELEDKRYIQQGEVSDFSVDLNSYQSTVRQEEYSQLLFRNSIREFKYSINDDKVSSPREYPQKNIDYFMLKIQTIGEQVSGTEADIRNLKDKISLEERDLIILHEKLKICSDQASQNRDIQEIRDSYKEQKKFKNSNIICIQKREDTIVNDLLAKMKKRKNSILSSIKETEKSLGEDRSKLELLNQSLNSLRRLNIELLEALEKNHSLF